MIPVPVSPPATTACRWLSRQGGTARGSGWGETLHFQQEGYSTKGFGNLAKLPRGTSAALWSASKMQTMHKATAERTSVECLVKGVSRALESAGVPSGQPGWVPCAMLMSHREVKRI